MNNRHRRVAKLRKKELNAAKVKFEKEYGVSTETATRLLKEAGEVTMKIPENIITKPSDKPIGAYPFELTEKGTLVVNMNARNLGRCYRNALANMNWEGLTNDPKDYPSGVIHNSFDNHR